jgi:cardiolipin synthase (CMP-forming)
MSRHSIPNMITIARLCAIPLFLWVYAQDAPGASWAAATLLLVMALSDVLDGFLARRFGWQTELGRALDPIADRVLFICLVSALLYFGVLPWWAVLPVVLRDAAMLAGSAEVYRRFGEKPEIMRGGKLANVILVCGIQFFIIDVRLVGWIVYLAGATLYVVTGARYAWREWHRLSLRGAAAGPDTRG